MSGATDRLKWTQVAQLVVERRQTQQRAASGCGVRQCGQRQFAMGRIVAARCGSVEGVSALVERTV